MRIGPDLSELLLLRASLRRSVWLVMTACEGRPEECEALIPDLASRLLLLAGRGGFSVLLPLEGREMGWLSEEQGEGGLLLSPDGQVYVARAAPGEPAPSEGFWRGWLGGRGGGDASGELTPLPWNHPDGGVAATEVAFRLARALQDALSELEAQTAATGEVLPPLVAPAGP